MSMRTQDELLPHLEARMPSSRGYLTAATADLASRRNSLTDSLRSDERLVDNVGLGCAWSHERIDESTKHGPSEVRFGFDTTLHRQQS